MNLQDNFHPLGCQGITATVTSTAFAINGGVFAQSVTSNGIAGCGTTLRITNEGSTNLVRYALGGPAVVAVSTVGLTMSESVLPLTTKTVQCVGETFIAIKTDASTTVVCIATGEGRP